MKRRALFLLLPFAVLLMGAGQIITGLSGDQPSCSALSGARDRIYIDTAGTSANDLAYACVKDAAGNYAWTAVPLVVATVTPINFPNMAALTCTSGSFTWTGVTDGEVIVAGIDSAMSANFQAQATATDTVTLRLCNPVNATLDPPNAQFRFERRLR